MKTIGFGGVFYTLWDIKSERVDVALGVWYYEVKCTYYKNLSKNLQDAIDKAGTDNVDESLRGKKRSFVYRKPVVLEPKIMTDNERLFRILLVNDKENLVDGVREEAFKRALELGFITKVSGEFSFTRYVQKGFDSRGQGIIEEVKIEAPEAYKWNGKLRNENTWYEDNSNKFFIGII
jgi:hypothetical protein